MLCERSLKVHTAEVYRAHRLSQSLLYYRDFRGIKKYSRALNTSMGAISWRFHIVGTQSCARDLNFYKTASNLEFLSINSLFLCEPIIIECLSLYNVIVLEVANAGINRYRWHLCVDHEKICGPHVACSIWVGLYWSIYGISHRSASNPLSYAAFR